jgi:D-3-phosphoglycerate dehydrogenase
MQPTVVFLGPDFGREAVQRAVGDSAKVLHSPSDQEALAAALIEADGLVDAAIRVRLTDEMVRNAPRLKVVSCASTGTDHVERGEITRRGIVVRSLSDTPQVIQSLTPAAELTWALILACARKLPTALTHVREGKWVREKFPGMMLNGRQLGLVGFGRIGGWMSRYAKAFGMRVVAYDPHRSNFPDDVKSVSLPGVLQTSDIVSVHVPLTQETNALISRDLLAAIKPGAIFINTSRGAIVDEAALLEGLQSGRISAAGLDVLQGEPEIAGHPLLEYARTHDNLLITPHCGGFSPDAVALVSAHAARVALEIIQRATP